jgi:hypothetical protein
MRNDEWKMTNGKDMALLRSRPHSAQPAGLSRLALPPGAVEISGYSHFFGFGGLTWPEAGTEYLEKRPNGRWAWQLPKPRGRTPLFKPFVMEFFDAATTKGDLTQEGAASFLVQERKAENEECF